MCVFFCLEQTGSDGENHIRVGKLNLVDLAGSERQAKTGAEVNDSFLVCVCVCMYVYMCMCVYICMCMCVCVCVGGGGYMHLLKHLYRNSRKFHR